MSVQPVHWICGWSTVWKNCHNLHHSWIGMKTFSHHHTIIFSEGTWKVYPLSIQIVLIMKICALKCRPTKCFLAHETGGKLPSSSEVLTPDLSLPAVPSSHPMLSVSSVILQPLLNRISHTLASTGTSKHHQE